MDQCQLCIESITAGGWQEWVAIGLVAATTVVASFSKFNFVDLAKSIGGVISKKK